MFVRHKGLTARYERRLAPSLPRYCNLWAAVVIRRNPQQGAVSPTANGAQSVVRANPLRGKLTPLSAGMGSRVRSNFPMLLLLPVTRL